MILATFPAIHEIRMSVFLGGARACGHFIPIAEGEVQQKHPRRGEKPMLRKLIVTSVLATGTLTGLAVIPAAADAHPPVRDYRHGFDVLRRCGWRWEVVGHYFDRWEAERVASRLRHHGEIIEVRPC
jgi:hypothetical protein